MPTTLQVAAYRCGVRASQAIVLIEIPWPTYQTTLKAAVFRLKRAFIDLMHHGQIPTTQYEPATKLLDDCLIIIRQPCEPWAGFPVDRSLECLELLKLVQQEAVDFVAGINSREELLVEWFELGSEIVDGDRDCKIDPSTGMRRLDNEVIWEVRDPDKVESLCAQLGVERCDLLPDVETELDKLFPYLYKFLEPNWAKVETGLRGLASQPGISQPQMAQHERSGRKPRLKPSWNRSSGELMYGGDVIKKIRLSRAKNVVQVLDSFEELGWRKHIPCPGKSSRTNETVRSLNDSLQAIRFHSEKNSDIAGGGIFWDAISSMADTDSRQPLPSVPPTSMRSVQRED